MSVFDPFRRAALITLAWWLIGFGIDVGTDAQPRKAPASSAGRFADQRQPTIHIDR